MLRFRSMVLAGATLLACSCVVSAITINPTYQDGIYGSWTATQIGVVEQAILDWENALPDNHIIDMTFDFTNPGATYLGRWSGHFSAYNGDDLYPWSSEVTHTIHVNAYFMNPALDHQLFFDPTPKTGGDQPFDDFDALSVLRHELGHALGITADFYFDNFNIASEYDKWSTHITGSTFDPGGLNVSLASTVNLSHLLDSGATEGDLMVPALVNGERRPISDTDLQMLQLAYGYIIQYPIIGADFNSDNIVDVIDLGILAGGWQTNAPFSAGDANGDGLVDVIDLGILAGLWQYTSPASGYTVPEPAMVSALSIVAPILARRRRV